MQPSLRCAFCHDGISGAETICLRCATRLHVECFLATRRCPTLGCRPLCCGTRKVEVLPPPPRGFTFVELGIVAVIICVLSSLLLPMLGPQCGSSPFARTAGRMYRVELALRDFVAATGDYPERLEQLVARGLSLELLEDAWGHAIRYTPRVPGHPLAGYLLVSAGRDGEIGTEDDLAATCDPVSR